MSITIELEPETEARLRERAERNGQDIGGLAADTLKRLVDDEDTSFETILADLRNRTPEQIALARAELLARSRRARPLPPGKTLEDVMSESRIPWAGLTDAQINAALEELS